MGRRLGAFRASRAAEVSPSRPSGCRAEAALAAGRLREMTDDEYQQYVDARFAELQARQVKIAELFVFEPEPDFPHLTIRFLDGEDLFVEAEVTPIGSRGHQAGSWMWAWANPSWPPELLVQASSLKGLGATTGREEFLSENAFPVTAGAAWGLAAVACEHLGGLGVYVLPVDGSDIFFAVRKLTRHK